MTRRQRLRRRRLERARLERRRRSPATRSTGAAGAGNRATLLATLGNVTTYTDTAVTNGTIYDYRITAVNALGEGPGSELRHRRPGPGAYGAPSWWNGDCDANWWNPRAAQLGWAGAGAHRLGRVVPRHPGLRSAARRRRRADRRLEPRRPGRVGVGVPRVRLPLHGAGLRRERLRGRRPRTSSATTRAAPAAGCSSSPTAPPARLPQPGDVISFDNPNGIGLVAVVGWSGVNASGNGEREADRRRTTPAAAGGGSRSPNWAVQPFGRTRRTAGSTIRRAAAPAPRLPVAATGRPHGSGASDQRGSEDAGARLHGAAGPDGRPVPSPT